MKKRLIFLFSLCFIFLTSFISAATPTSCDYYLNESITFDSDLNCTSDYRAFKIDANDIIIDCAGYTIRTNVSNSIGVGFENLSASNVTLKNCIFENFTSTFYMVTEGVEGLTLENITITGNEESSWSTMEFRNMTNLTIRNMTILDTKRPYEATIKMRDINNSLIDGLIMNEIYDRGIQIYTSTGITIINSIIRNALTDYGSGINLYDTNGTFIDNLTFYNITGNAIYMNSVKDTLVNDVTIDTIPEPIDGIFIRDGGDNITLENIRFSNMNMSDYAYYQIWIEDTEPTDQLLLKNITFFPHLQQIYIGTSSFYPSNNINLTGQSTNTSVAIRVGGTMSGIRFNTTELFFDNDCFAYGEDFMSVNGSCYSLNQSAEILFVEYLTIDNYVYNYTIYVNDSEFPETNTSILETTIYEDNIFPNYDYDYDGFIDSLRVVVDHFSGYAIAARDRDNDSIADYLDNCIDESNANQADSDGDGIGDVCDTTSSSGGSSTKKLEVSNKIICPDNNIEFNISYKNKGVEDVKIISGDSTWFTNKEGLANITFADEGNYSIKFKKSGYSYSEDYVLDFKFCEKAKLSKRSKATTESEEITKETKLDEEIVQPRFNWFYLILFLLLLLLLILFFLRKRNKKTRK